MIHADAMIRRMFTAWPKLKRLDISAVEMPDSFDEVDLPTLSPLAHLALRIYGDSCETFVADIVRQSVSTLIHLELYAPFSADLGSILSSRPLKFHLYHGPQGR